MCFERLHRLRMNRNGKSAQHHLANLFYSHSLDVTTIMLMTLTYYTSFQYCRVCYQSHTVGGSGAVLLVVIIIIIIAAVVVTVVLFLELIWLFPVCRYRSVNLAYFRPHQVRDLYDGTDVDYINEIVRQAEQKGRKYGEEHVLRDSILCIVAARHFTVQR